jgi:hypothetical protein
MKRSLVLIALVWISAGIAVKGQSASEIIPADGWLDGWQTAYDVVSYEGDDLFFLINGGADLYMEYGFLDVAAVEYVHPQKGKFYMELYRMDSDSAAYGIFSLRSGGMVARINPAPWVVYGNDFLHIWNGNYYVSVSAASLQKASRMGVFTSIVGYLNEKILGENILPYVIYRKGLSDKAQYVNYIMGPLALNNIYNFGQHDLFKSPQCLVIDEDDGRLLVFFYEDEASASGIYDQVVSFMKTSARYSDLQDFDNGFRVKDPRGNIILGERKKDSIVVKLLAGD